MNKNLQDGMTCSQFEALLADALDATDGALDDTVNTAMADAGDKGKERSAPIQAGALSPEVRRAFDAHRLSCPVCAPLFAEVQEGMRLLQGIVELDPPRHLVHNILAATSRAEATATLAGVKAPVGWIERLRRNLRPSVAGLLHSRFAASFCMAFFSLSLTLTLAGVKITDLAKVAHPEALRKSVVLQYTQVEAKVMRYYDNMRFVYEIESRVQQIKKAAAPVQNDNNNKNNSQPEQQNRNHTPGNGRQDQEEPYSQERDGSLIAQSTSKHEGALL